MIKRQIIFSDKQDLALQFLPNFVIRPCPDNFPKPPFEIGHYPYFIDFTSREVTQKTGILDYSFRLDNKPKFSDFNLSPIPISISQKNENLKVYSETLILINTLSNSYFFDYKGKQHWALLLDGSFEHIYGQEGYNAPDFQTTIESFEEIPNYDLIDPMSFSFQKRNSIKKIKFNDLLNIFYSSDKTELKKMYLNACIVLNKSFEIREIDLSASYLFMVSAIEALIRIEHLGESNEICNSCKQPMYKVSRKFKDFIDKYGYEVDNKTKNKFYSMRSNIAHSGQLLELSHNNKIGIESQEDFDLRYKREMDRLYYDSFKSLAKICFITFLFDNLKPMPNTV